ncbi:co-chaperone HscB [Candidatus Albibeggiatoa sp. nov. NOAA]|uniref:co-chaperone HscB n=1 Tax=Candidatus Albibeggiatoa sp. nov. NOAA TaxID=3162724 RepID=UPI0032FDFD47|nr:co-chaperone HscB [Thiotrichaceae bacterium]
MSLTSDFFTLFNLPVAFEIDVQSLTARYRELQRTVHPDKFADAPERDRRLALQQAAHINEAFNTLKAPLSRGRYLLQLKGFDTQEQQNTAMDPAFLMQQMDLREQLAAVKEIDALNDFLTELEQQTQILNNQLKQQFIDETYEQAGDTVRKLQFFHKLNEEAMQLEEDLLD